MFTLTHTSIYQMFPLVCTSYMFTLSNCLDWVDLMFGNSSDDDLNAFQQGITDRNCTSFISASKESSSASKESSSTTSKQIRETNTMGRNMKVTARLGHGIDGLCCVHKPSDQRHFHCPSCNLENENHPYHTNISRRTECVWNLF